MFTKVNPRNHECKSPNTVCVNCAQDKFQALSWEIRLSSTVLTDEMRNKHIGIAQFILNEINKKLRQPDANKIPLAEIQRLKKEAQFLQARFLSNIETFREKGIYCSDQSINALKEAIDAHAEALSSKEKPLVEERVEKFEVAFQAFKLSMISLQAQLNDLRSTKIVDIENYEKNLRQIRASIKEKRDAYLKIQAEIKTGPYIDSVNK